MNSSNKESPSSYSSSPKLTRIGSSPKLTTIGSLRSLLSFTSRSSPKNGAAENTGKTSPKQQSRCESVLGMGREIQSCYKEQLRVVNSSFLPPPPPAGAAFGGHHEDKASPSSHPSSSRFVISEDDRDDDDFETKKRWRIQSLDASSPNGGTCASAGGGGIRSGSSSPMLLLPPPTKPMMPPQRKPSPFQLPASRQSISCPSSPASFVPSPSAGSRKNQQQQQQAHHHHHAGTLPRCSSYSSAPSHYSPTSASSKSKKEVVDEAKARTDEFNYAYQNFYQALSKTRAIMVERREAAKIIGDGKISTSQQRACSCDGDDEDGSSSSKIGDFIDVLYNGVGVNKDDVDDGRSSSSMRRRKGVVSNTFPITQDEMMLMAMHVLGTPEKHKSVISKIMMETEKYADHTRTKGGAATIEKAKKVSSRVQDRMAMAKTLECCLSCIRCEVLVNIKLKAAIMEELVNDEARLFNYIEEVQGDEKNNMRDLLDAEGLIEWP